MIVTSNPDFWEAVLKKPLVERLASAPDELLAYVELVNASTGNPHRPHAAIIPKDFLVDVRAAIQEMPSVIKEKLSAPLLGVYFGHGLGSSGITDVVVKITGELVGVVTVLDLDALLNRSANEWATWKENTPFITMGSYRIEAIIENDKNNNRKNAIQYLLLHEFGHVLTARNMFLPNWWLSSQYFKSTDEYTFLPLSWQITMTGEIIPLLREDFKHRKLIAYYTENKLPSEDVMNFYESLEKTSFATLYAATNSYDDFAESFASYVHFILLKKPFEIRIRHENKIIMHLENYWLSKRCTAKYQILAEYLGES